MLNSWRLISLVCLVVLGGVGTAQTILPNGSAELVDGTLSHWDIKTAGASVYVDSAFAQEGSRCLKLDFATDSNQECTHAIFAVEPGVLYHVKGYYRTFQPVSTGSISVTVRWFADHRRIVAQKIGESIIVQGVGTVTTATWTSFEADVLAPSNAIGADLTIAGIASALAGNVYFDNLSIVKSSGGHSATLYMIQEGNVRQGAGYVPLARLDLLNCIAGFFARGAGNEYVFLYGGPDYAQPHYRWALMLASFYGVRLDFSCDMPAQYWPLVNRFKSQLPSQQYIKYSYAVLNSSRWAMSIGGLENHLVCDTSLASEAQAMADFSEKENFSTGWTEQQVWQRYSANLASNKDVVLENVTDAAAGDSRTCYLNDLAICDRSWIFWDEDRGEPRNTYLAWLNDNARHMGVSAGDEGNRLSEMSVHGVRTVPADWVWNLATHRQFASRNPRTALRMRPLSPRDITWEDNVSYCTFVVTDGDNLQVLGGEWLFDPRWYSSARRGTIALGWQLPPSMAQYAPIILESLVDPLSPLAVTNKDCFVTGVSGDGVLFVGGPSDSAHAFGASSSKGTELIRDHTAALNLLLKQQAVNVITAFTWNRGTWLDYNFANYTEALERPLGVLVDTYSRSYVDGQGEIKWSPDKDGHEMPVKAVDYSLWDSPDGKTTAALAFAINAAPHTGSPVAGSFIHVAAHAWSWMQPPYQGIVEEIYKTTTLMASHIRVVRPDELLMQMRFRLRSGVELVRYYDSLLAKTTELEAQVAGAMVGAATALAEAKESLAGVQPLIAINPGLAFSQLQAADRLTEIARLSFVELSRGATAMSISCPGSAPPLFNFTPAELNPSALPVAHYRLQVADSMDFETPRLDKVITDATIALPPVGHYARVQAVGEHGDAGNWSAVANLQTTAVGAWDLYTKLEKFSKTSIAKNDLVRISSPSIKSQHENY